MAPAVNARASARPVTVVYVMPGDTVLGIARRYGVPAQSIIDANGLSEPYHLMRGQRIVLPPSSVHIVEPGETVSSIARSYGVANQAVVDANELSDADNLRAGQRIAIPFVDPPARPARAAPVTAEQPSQSDPRVEGGRYYALGRPRPKPVFDGQGGPDGVDPPDETTDLDAAYDAKKPRAKPAVADASAKSSNRFIWPVKGNVISGFGRRGSGMHNDGINIAAEPGAPVKAAEDGVVAYAGNELAGYGNLLLLRHASGYVTAYAHNKRLLVDRGDSVRRGQTIALVGSTGDVDRPQLHFEIRKGDRAVDPRRYLARDTASR